MRVEPLFDNVLVLVDQISMKTEGGLHLPDSAAQELKDEQERGTVIATGPGRPDNDKALSRPMLPMALSVGDRVLFSKYSGNELSFDGKDYLLLPEQVIMGIVHDE
jgi:chaperonin GroES